MTKILWKFDKIDEIALNNENKLKIWIKKIKNWKILESIYCTWPGILLELNAIPQDILNQIDWEKEINYILSTWWDWKNLSDTIKKQILSKFSENFKDIDSNLNLIFESNKESKSDNNINFLFLEKDVPFLILGETFNLKSIYKMDKELKFGFFCGINNYGYKIWTLIPIKITYSEKYSFISWSPLVYRIQSYPFLLSKFNDYESKEQVIDKINLLLQEMGYWDYLNLTKENQRENKSYIWSLNLNDWFCWSYRKQMLKEIISNPNEKNFFAKIFYWFLWIWYSYDIGFKEFEIKKQKFIKEYIERDWTYSTYSSIISKERQSDLLNFMFQEYGYMYKFSNLKSYSFGNLIEHIDKSFHLFKRKFHPIEYILKKEQNRVSSISENIDFSQIKFWIMEYEDFLETNFRQKEDNKFWNKNWYFQEWFYHYLYNDLWFDNINKKIWYIEYQGIIISVIALKKYKNSSFVIEGNDSYSISFISTHYLLQGNGFAWILLEKIYQWLNLEHEKALIHSSFSENWGKSLYPLSKEFWLKYWITNFYNNWQIEGSLEDHWKY